MSVRSVVHLLSINGLVLLLLLVGLEVGARVFFPRDPGGMLNDPTVFIRGRPFVVPDAHRGFALSPGFDNGRYRINQAGFRGADLPTTMGNRPVILVIGDSGTFGWCVDEPSTYPAQLQKLCDENCPSRPCVVNGGVPSYTSTQVLIYLRQLLPQLRPRVVVVSVFWNDVLCSALSNWLPEYLIIQQPAPWRQWLIRHAALYRALMIREAPKSRLRAAAINELAIAHYRSNLRSMAEECRKAKAELLLLAPSFNEAAMPAQFMKLREDDLVTTESMSSVIAAFNQHLLSLDGTPGIDVLSHRLSPPNAVKQENFLDLMHPSASGYHLIAEDILTYFQDSGLCESPKAAVARSFE